MPKNDHDKHNADNIELRPVSDGDEEFLVQLFISVRSGQFASIGLDKEQLSQLLKTQYEYQKQSYGMQFPEAEHTIILIEGEKIGRLILNKTDTELRLVDISILQEFRNAGTGTKLVCALQAEGIERDVPVVLTVAAENLPARRLYERLGFKEMASDSLNISMEWNKKAV